MLRRSNKGKNTTDEPAENRIASEEQVSRQTMSREEFFAQNEEARKMFEDIRSLRQSVENLKATEVEGEKQELQPEPTEERIYLKETEEIIAAKQAVLEQAKRDAMEEKARREALLRKEQEALLEQQRMLEADQRVALMEEKAERKRQQAIEAERMAKKVARRKELEAMEAERPAKVENAGKQEETPRQPEKATGQDSFGSHDGRATATPAELASFFDERTAAVKQAAELESAKHALLLAQKEQEAALGRASRSAEINTGRLAEEQRDLLEQRENLIKEEQAKVNAMFEDFKEKRQESVERDQAQRAARAKAAKEERQSRAIAEREERKARIKQKRQERIRKAEERELIKKAKKDAAARVRLEKLRLEKKSRADAELGGGVVKVKGVTVNTAIKDTLHISWKDFFGLRDKQERNAETEQEKLELKEEREKRREEARVLVDRFLKHRSHNYRESRFTKKFKAFMAFCDRRKTVLLIVFATVLTILVATAGVFNYYTAYAYSYNGRELGVVKEKDDVLRITDLVQGALTEDKDVDVTIDARKDIDFDRVVLTGDVKIDTSEDVLKRLTYMGDLNVTAYCIFIDGKKVGAVESKAIAEEVFRSIEARYTSGMENSKVEKIEIIEKWEAKEDNISLEKVMTQEEMVELLCTSGEKESLHQVTAGETLADIAKLYSLTEEEILDDNEGVDPKKLKVDSKLVIRQTAPILTVKITEKVTYEKEIPYEVQEKEDPDIYEGYTELQQQGENGLNEITSRITLVNGEQIDEKALVTTVKQEAVTEVVLVGTKERPPSVGSGKYIWPIDGSYSISSGFKYRWGRLHAGIDLACNVGTNVIAADGGVVTYAGYSGAYGYLVKIDHQNGMETRYAHNSKLLVKEGDKVFQGQHIAESGNTGRSTGPHLHFEIRVSGTPKNPMNYLP